MVRFLHRGNRRQAREEYGAKELARRLTTITEPTSIASEAYRSLRTNLVYATPALATSSHKVIALTSPGPGEGKSTTCANLGVVLAQASKSTLILDCDFRKPVMHKFFGLRNIHGVTDILIGERSPQQVWHEPLEGLKIITVGTKPLNPTEILASQSFSKFLADIRNGFDYMLVDTAPTGPVADPAIVAVQVDGVLLVVDAQNTRKGALQQSIRSLETVGANVLGIVMNNTLTSEMGYYGSYTKYSTE